MSFKARFILCYSLMLSLNDFFRFTLHMHRWWNVRRSSSILQKFRSTSLRDTYVNNSWVQSFPWTGNWLSNCHAFASRNYLFNSALCQFCASKYMPLSDETVVIFSSSIFTEMLAYCFVSKKWSKRTPCLRCYVFLVVLRLYNPAAFWHQVLNLDSHFIVIYYHCYLCTKLL